MVFQEPIWDKNQFNPYGLKNTGFPQGLQLNAPVADIYAKYLKDPTKLKTPTIVVHEVYKEITREKTEEEALLAVSALHRTSIIELNESISLLAADLSLKHGLPMADAIVYLNVA